MAFVPTDVGAVWIGRRVFDQDLPSWRSSVGDTPFFIAGRQAKPLGPYVGSRSGSDLTDGFVFRHGC